MLWMLKLEKEDIITCPAGLNIAIGNDPNGLQIIFSPEAAMEFVQDVTGLIVEVDEKYQLREDWKEYIEEYARANRATANDTEDTSS